MQPNLILTNGKIHTLDAGRPTASAVACLNGRFVAVGDDAAVGALAGPGTTMVNLHGATVIPAFNDAHNHMLEQGLKLSRVRLDECASIAEMATLVREAGEHTPAGQWIIGEGWNESNFAEQRLPNRHDLDAATTRHPVVLKRFFNMDVVNTAALARAGVDAHTPDPAGGKIEHLADGSSSGILRAAAKLFVRNLLPDPTLDECLAALESVTTVYHRMGITSILEPGLMPWEMQAYMTAHRTGRLKMRCNLMVSWHGFREHESEATCDERARNVGVFSGLGDEWLSLGGLKMAVDGGTTSHTAWMFQPFVGESVVRDYNRLNPAQLRRYFETGHELGWDIGIHAIGDRAHHESAAAFAAVLDGEVPSQPDAMRAVRLKDTPGWADHRHNLIHAYFATEDSLTWMAEHQIAAVIQPTFIYYEGDDVARDCGPELANRYKPMRTYLNRGIPVIATSDVPSTVWCNPMVSLYALVTRKSHKGTPVAPHEAVTREEALRACTVAGAWLTREEHIKGPIVEGMLADLCVLDADYFACDAEAIKDIAVTMTVCGGRIVWQAPVRV